MAERRDDGIVGEGSIADSPKFSRAPGFDVTLRDRFGGRRAGAQARLVCAPGQYVVATELKVIYSLAPGKLMKNSRER